MTTHCFGYAGVQSGRTKFVLLLVLVLLLAPISQSSSASSAGFKAPIPGLAHYVYVDLSQQRLYEVHHGAVTAALPVSTGGGYRYKSSNGSVHVAVTPVGRFRIYSKLAGWHRSYLGSMYYPNYFDGGYAIHGDPYVPRYPVSHGCIRIPMWAARGFYARNGIGTPVFVVH
jgi:lipoprotein-anchoring transpeptidase ErfK/SrfK